MNCALHVVWGKTHLNDLENNIKNYKVDLNHFLITDNNSVNFIKDKSLFKDIIIVKFNTKGNIRCSEFFLHLHKIPKEYENIVFLDSDTIVLENIDLGFKVAKRFGMGIVIAPHADLNFYMKTSIINRELDSSDYPVYNSGVVFFNRYNQSVLNVLEEYYNLSRKIETELKQNDKSAVEAAVSDQTMLSMAIAKLKFNPYSLDCTYNYRHFGEIISGKVKIWHSNNKVLSEINKVESLRRYIIKPLEIKNNPEREIFW